MKISKTVDFYNTKLLIKYIIYKNDCITMFIPLKQLTF